MDKLKIENLDKKTSFEVLFNPNELTVEDSSKWEDQYKQKQLPEIQYTGGARKVLTMELFFDTYEQKQDVRDHTSQIAALLVVSDDISNGKRPAKVKLTWGKAEKNPLTRIFPFECVLEKLTQKFTLFTSDGTPVRATLNVTFKEYSLPKEELKRKVRRRSFPLQTYTVKSGDTLGGIAAELWEDPRQWRRIAEANKIYNPRFLSPGQALEIPAIED